MIVPFSELGAELIRQCRRCECENLFSKLSDRDQRAVLALMEQMLQSPEPESLLSVKEDNHNENT